MTINNYKPINRNYLLASFDLTLPSGILICEMKLFTGQNGHFVKFPERPYTKGDGTQGYARIIAIPDRARSDAFNTAVIEALTAGGYLA